MCEEVQAEGGRKLNVAFTVGAYGQRCFSHSTGGTANLLPWSILGSKQDAGSEIVVALHMQPWRVIVCKTMEHRLTNTSELNYFLGVNFLEDPGDYLRRALSNALGHEQQPLGMICVYVRVWGMYSPQVRGASWPPPLLSSFWPRLCPVCLPPWSGHAGLRLSVPSLASLCSAPPGQT